MAENYEIQLGIGLNDSDFSDIKTKIKSLEDDRIKIKLDTKDVDNQIDGIKKQLQDLNKGNNKNLFTLDTSKLESSLTDVKNIITDIKNALGTIDNSKGINSLVSSVSQISKVLDTASNKIEGLSGELSALSKKDFSINLGIDMGKKNLSTVAYGRAARKQVIPELESQIKELESLLGGQQATMKKITQNGKEVGFDIFSDFNDFNSDSAIKKMEAMEKYVNSLKKLASIEGIKLDGFNDIHKNATELINDITGVENAVDKAGDVPEKLKNLLGGSIDGENLFKQLDSIIKGLGEIKTAIQGLSSGISIDGLTQSFDKLSDSIELLVKNCTTAKQAINDTVGGLSGSAGGTDSGVKNLNNDLKQVTVTADNTADAIRQVANEQKNASGQLGDINLKDDITEVDEFSAALSKLKNIQKNMDSVQVKLSSGLDASKDIKTIQVLENQLESLRVEFNETTTVLNNKGGVSSTQFQSLQNEAKNTELKLEQLEAKVTDVRNNLAKKIFLNLEAGEFTTEITKVTSNAKKLSGVSEEVEINIKQLNTALSNMKTASANGDVDGLIKSYKEFKYTLEAVENQLKQNKIAKQDWDNVEKLNQQKQALSLDMDNWLKDNSAAAKKFGDTIRQLQVELKSCDDVNLGNIKREFQNVKREAESLGLATQTLGDRIKSKFKEYSAYFSVAEVFMYTEQALRSMFEQVKLIDSAMTELKKVTDETDESYNQFLTNAASKAKEIGTTIDGLVSSTADFARLGYGFEDAQGLAEVANIYAVVGDEIEGVEGATQSLISTIAAFKDEMNGLSDSDFALSIVDKLNEVANNYSISSGGLGEALQRSASSLATGNNTLDESISLITAANEVVQNPEKVGNAMKTISMRIRSAKSEMEQMGENTEGMVESTATLRAEIKALSGVDIMASATEFKSTYQILDELSEKWEDLSDIARATIIEKMAGKHQGNIFSSLMENFDTARNALETSLNSAGSAMEEHGKWSQSLEAKLNSLSASWQGLSQAFLNSDFLKSALDSVIGLVDGITSLIDTLGTLPTLITAFTAFKSLTGGGIFKTIKDEATGAATGITNVFKLAAERVTRTFDTISLRSDSSFKTGLQDDIIALQNYHNAVQGGMSKTEALSTHMKNAGSAAVKFAQDGKFVSNWTEEFTKQQQSAQVSTLAQNKTLGNARAIIKEYYNGCKNVGMGQAEFANAVSKTNPILGKQLNATKSAKSAFSGYITSLIGAKVATVALEIATMAMNTALTMGVSALISLAIKGVDKLIKTSSELAEEVEELTSKFKEQHNELKKLQGDYDTTNESSMVSKYEKLSKGVDNLGRNVSLTADEYSEYQSIVDTIAEQIPSLVSGYDEHGNAILSCKDNVEALTTAYEKLIHAQNTEILTNTKDIEKNFENILKKSNGEHWWSNGHGFWKGLLGNDYNGGENFVTKFFDYELKTDTVRYLEKLLDGSEKYNKDKIYEQISQNRFSESEIRTLLENANVEIGYFDNIYDVLEETLETDPSKIKNAIDNYYEQFAEEVEQQKTIAQAKLSEAFDISSAISGLNYENISEELQAVANQTVNSLDFDFFSKLKEDGITVEQWTDKILSQLDSIDNLDKDNKIESAFDLQTQFNGGDISYGEYVAGLEDAGRLIEQLDLDSELESQLKLSLGLDEEGLVKGYHDLANRLADETQFDIDYDTYHKFLDGLTAEEQSVLIDIIPELSESEYRENINDIENALRREMIVQGLTFDLNLEVEAAGIESLNTALAESVSATGLSTESINALKGRYSDLESQGYDLSVMFEETSNGIHLNREEFNKLEKEYSTQKLTTINSELEEMKAEYDRLGEELKTCSSEAKAGIYNDRLTLAKKISEAATLASQYEGLTSAYNDWLTAEESGQERGMYEQVIEGFENVGDEISRGWYDDGTIKFLELITGETDLAVKSSSELKDIWKGLDKNIKNTSYSVKDFFTVDEDGNSTSTGVYNFLRALQELESSNTKSSVLDKAFKDIENIEELVTVKDGKITKFNFDIVGGEKAIADALGISEELVQIITRAADDAGFVVNMDGAYQQLADLQNEARSSVNYLNELFGEEYSFDFNTSNLDSLTKDLEEAKNILNKTDKNGKKLFWNEDGTFNFDVDGATEAMTIVSTLQAKLDTLSQEQYGIGLTVEDNKYEDVLNSLQDYGETIAKLNQLELNPVSNAEEIEKLKTDLNTYAQELNSLPDDIKVEIGLVGEDGKTPLNDVEAIKNKAESGEIKIPTTLDIQTNMDKNIETLADLALLDSGLLSESQEETIKKKYNIELEADEVDSSNIDDKIEETLHGGIGRQRNTRKTNVEVIAETFGVEHVDDLSKKLEGLDDKTIQAVAEVIGQVDVDLLKNTIAKIQPKTVEAIAKAIGEGDVEELKNSINNLDSTHVQAIAEAFGYDDVNELNTAIEGMDGNIVQAVAQALGITDVNTLQTTINNMQGNTVDAGVNTDGQSEKVTTLQSSINGLQGNIVVAGVNTEGQSSKVDTLQTKINSLKGKIVKVGVEVASGGKKKAAQRTGADPAGNDSEVNGTANVNGTAFKQGSWGTKDSGTALVGELGAETLVRQGKYYVIGSKGAEFIKYQKGDIIFNHKQTEELFKNGKVTSGGGRAKAFVNGASFLQGTAFTGGYGGGEEPKDDDDNKSSSSDKDFEEVLDWIEVILDRVERSIDKFDQQANNIYKNWSSRNNALLSQISEVNKEISLQQQAYNKYIAAANGVGLSSDWAAKVRNGAIDIDTIKDEALADKIKSYQEW